MYIETAVEPSERWGMTRPKRSSVMTCDSCGEQFTRKYSTHYVGRELHFCTQRCSNDAARSGGKKHTATVETCHRRYGVDNPQQVPTICASTMATNIERYGVAHSIASDVVKAKIAVTNEQRHGCHPTQLAETKAKMLKTRVERYGTSAPVHDDADVSAKYRATMMERYGVGSPLQSEKLRKKVAATCVQRHGVENVLQGGSKFRSKEGCIKGGQVGYRSLVRQGKLQMISKPERIARAAFIEAFGDINVEHQVEVDHGGRKPWLIDFHIKSIDVYVEVDGVFWHGLDRPYDQLHEQKKKKFDADRRQDQWFVDNDMKLVRITDQQVLQCVETSDFSTIIECLGG